MHPATYPVVHPLHYAGAIQVLHPLDVANFNLPAIDFALGCPPTRGHIRWGRNHFLSLLHRLKDSALVYQ